jgi:hypothetical protein
MATPSLLGVTSAVGQILCVTRPSGTTATTVYTVPASNSVKIATGALCNTTASAVTVSLSVVASGGTASASNQIISGYSLAANDTLSLGDYLGGTFLGDGDFISVTASTGNAVVVWLSGVLSNGSSSGGVSSYTDEQVRDVIAAALVAGSGITITPNDGADTITLAASGGGAVASVNTRTGAVTGLAEDSAVVHNTGAETVAGVKTFSASPIVPTPTTGTQAVNKTYADGLVAGGAADATTGSKGIVQLAGDLAGTAASPTVPGKMPYLVPTAVKTSAYTAAANEFVLVDTTSGNVPITLPTAPADKARVGVKHVVRGGTNTVGLVLGGSDVLNVAGGAQTATLTLLNQAAILQYQTTGAIWLVVSSDLSLSQLDARFAATGSGGSTWDNGWFGDGSDGSATLDGAATPSWATRSGSNYTLSQSVNLDTLTINSGVTLKTGGLMVCAKTAIAGSGTILWNGTAASSATGATAAIGNFLAGSTAAGAGGTGAGTAGTNQASHLAYGGAGAAGGNGSSGSGGAGGTVVAPTATMGGTQVLRRLPNCAQGFAVGNAGAATNPFRGGTGGGGGSGDATNSGGGGGSGGGVVIVNAKSIASTVTVSATGGAGFTPTTGNCGGGGGGGGGLIVINTAGVTGGSSPTMTVTGGAGGSGVGTGTAGSTGAAGLAILNVFA